MKKGCERTMLVNETASDSSLKSWRMLAEHGQRDYIMRDGLLLRQILDKLGEEKEMIEFPRSARKKVLSLAHEKCGHLGSRKVKELVQKHFTWPSVGKNVAKHCTSCSTCQTVTKSGSRKVPMVNRSVLNEPFESVGFDLVGSLPKGRGGCRYILTDVCLASRWPDAITLRTVTAKTVARGMVEIMPRTGIPGLVSKL